MNLYILEVLPKKKEMTVVISERLLMNLVPLKLELLAILKEIFPDYRVYEIDEKHFKNAVSKQATLEQVV